MKVAELKRLTGKRVRKAGSMEVIDRIDATGPNAGAKQELPALLVWLRQLVAERLKVSKQEVDIDSGYYELGLTSLDLMEFGRSVRAKLGVNLPPTLFFEFTTIAELAAHLAENYAISASEQVAPQARGQELAERAGSADLVAHKGREVGRRVTPAAQPENRAELRRRTEDIAIIGMAGQFPQARNVEEFCTNLKQGKDCIVEIPESRWDHRLYFDEAKNKPGKTHCKWGGFIEGVDQFDPLFFNISPLEAMFMDPQERLFLQCVWALLESSGNTRRDLKTRYNDSIGVYVGAMYQHYRVSAGNPNTEAITSLSTFSGIANRVSSFFDFKGPSIAVDTTCSSAAIAIHMACRDLASGDCKLAIVGGTNLSIHPNKYVGLSQIQLIGSRSNSRSFSAGDGYLPSEVISAALLKPLHEAVADGDKVLAVIKSTSTNHRGRSSGYSVPSVNSLTQLLVDNFEKSNIDPSTIGYVEAAANGLPLADAVEFRALTKAFRTKTSGSGFCAIGSVKSNIGHAEAASAMSQLTKIVLQFQDKVIFPSLQPSIPNPDIDFEGSPFVPQTTMSDWSVARRDLVRHPRRAILNSFGAGGSNVSMILEEYIEADSDADEIGDTAAGDPRIMVFSAKTRDCLRAQIEQALCYLTTHPRTSLSRLAYTLQLKREPMECRAAVVASTRDELSHILFNFMNSSSRDRPEDQHQIHLGALSDTDRFVGDLITDKGAAALLATLADENSHDRIAQLWVRGAKIPWENLYGNWRPRPLPLPTYPFAKERYWLSPDGREWTHPRDEQSLIAISDERQSPLTALPSSAIRGVMDLLSQILRLPAERITPEAGLRDYGFNSLGAMMVRSACESNLEISLQIKDVLSCGTVRDLSDLIVAHVSNKERAASLVPAELDIAAESKIDASSLEILEQFREGSLTRVEVERLIQQGALG